MLLRIILNHSIAVLALFNAHSGDGLQEPPAKRLSAIVGVAVEEYAKGVNAKGQLVSSTEFEEAAGFLRDAKDVAKRLTSPNSVAVRVLLDSISNAAARRAAPAELDAIHLKFMKALGAEGALDFPKKLATLAQGRAIFEQNCVACHGAAGAGDGPRAAEFTPHPAAIGNTSMMHDRTPALMYRIVSVGVQGTMMAGWSSKLSSDERWAVVQYVNSLRANDLERKAGASLIAGLCKDCNSAKPPIAKTYAWQAEHSDDDIAALLKSGDATVGIKDGGKFTPDQIASTIAALRASPMLGDAAAAGVAVAAAPADSADPRTAARHSIRLINDALAAAKDGKPADAGDLAFDAYIAFEPLEGPARMRNPGLVAQMERNFADFKGAVKAKDLSAASEARDNIEKSMPAVLELAGPTTTTWGVFLESFLIIVREGFEAILVIGAVVAFLIKTGNRKRLKDIWIGSVAGLAASAALAVVLRTVLAAVPASRDVIEGATMLVAVVVLFSVSYWLLSKIEGAKWQKFIREKVNAALSEGGSFALAFVAFLAVFREGAETALFYQALFTRGESVAMPVAMGLLVGFAVLAVIFTLFYRFGVKIPMRPFFAVTGGLLYYMAFVFAGKGIKELQEGNVISQTQIPGFPHVEMLGLYPTVETLLAQGILLALLLFALWRTLAPSTVEEDAEIAAAPSAEPIPAEVAARLAELTATARRLQDRVTTLEKEIELESVVPKKP
jgi:high-affinity iron transporter